MALQAEERIELRRALVSAIGEKGAEIMLSQFPSRDLDEPVTKDFVRAEGVATRAELHTEIMATRNELRAEIGQVRDELRAEIGQVRDELRAEIGQVREGLGGEIATVKTGLLALEVRTERLVRHQTRWIVSTLVAIGAVLTASNWLS